MLPLYRRIGCEICILGDEEDHYCIHLLLNAT
jgi:hypothetical protein